MSEEIHRKLVAFLSGEFARTENRACVRFDLASAQPGSRGDILRTWDRKENPEVFEGLSSIEPLATEIVRLAEEHAESFGGGAHRFEVRTEQYLGGRQKTSFRIRVDGDADAPGGGDDAPTATGLVGQLMRHLEVKERVQAAMYQTTIGTMSRMISDFSGEARELRLEQRARENELEEARSRQAERDLEGLRQISADKRKDQAFERILALLPVAASRMLGGGSQGDAPGEKQTSAALSILANELADSLSQEQFLRIAGALGPNQQILLGELIRTAKQARAREQGGDQGAGQTPSPDAAAAGG